MEEKQKRKRRRKYSLKEIKSQQQRVRVIEDCQLLDDTIKQSYVKIMPAPRCGSYVIIKHDKKDDFNDEFNIKHNSYTRTFSPFFMHNRFAFDIFGENEHRDIISNYTCLDDIFSDTKPKTEGTEIKPKDAIRYLDNRNVVFRIKQLETEKYEEYLLMDLSIKKFKLISGNLTSNPKKATEPKPGQDLMEECFPSLGQALLAVRKSTFRRYVDNKGKEHAIQIINMKYLY